MAKRKRKSTVTQQIMAEAKAKLSDIKHDSTRSQYIRHTKLFVKYCREHHDCRSLNDCRQYLQEYCDHLQQQSYSPSTIHTYVAAPCRVLNIKMSTVKKPIRHVADYTRGRSGHGQSTRDNIDDPRWAYVVEFQRMVGIRRDELMRLRGGDFVTDESTYPCVYVRRGKGGKPQLQRINNADAESVKKYFDNVADDELVFDKKLFQNDLNFHALRADCAKRYYKDTLERINKDAGYAAQLEAEIRKRWELYCRDKHGRVKHLPNRDVYGWYTVRGRNRVLAVKKGYPLSYNKIALLAISIFKLSHWRNDVTTLYMLA